MNDQPSVGITSGFYVGLSACRARAQAESRRPFSDPSGDLIDRWEHRDGQGRGLPGQTGAIFHFRPYLSRSPVREKG